MTDARRAFGWLPNALGIFPENVTLRFFSAGWVGVRFVCDVPHASFCGLYIEGGSIGIYDIRGVVRPIA